MSHSTGAIRFNNGDIFHVEYNGTVDVLMPIFYDTQDELDLHWRRRDYPRICECKDNEVVDIAVTYGGGFSWQGMACRRCKQVTEQLTPHSYEGNEDTGYSNGIPEWYPKW